MAERDDESPELEYLRAIRADEQHNRDRLAPRVDDVWDASVAPGGYVCAACGMPTESEPCSEHQSEPVRENACKCPGSGTMAHVRGCRLHPEAGR